MNRRNLILGLIAAPAIDAAAVIDGIEDTFYYRCYQYKGVTIYSPGIPARFLGTVSRAADEYGHGIRCRRRVDPI
jgi:hypothetical protein